MGTPIVYDYLVPAHICRYMHVSIMRLFFSMHILFSHPLYLLYSVDRSSACDWSTLLMLKIIHFARVPLP